MLACQAAADGRLLKIPHPATEKSPLSHPAPHRRGVIWAVSGHSVGRLEGLRRQSAQVQYLRGFQTAAKFTYERLSEGAGRGDLRLWRTKSGEPVTLDWYKLLYGLRLACVDPVVNNSRGVRCISKFCKKIRVATLGVLAVVNVLGKLVKSYETLMVNHDSDFCACHQELGKILQNFVLVTPFHFRGQKDFLLCRPCPLVCQTSDIEEPFALVIPWAGVWPTLPKLVADMRGGLIAHGVLRRSDTLIISRTNTEVITRTPCLLRGMT